ncbi:PF07588 family protein [Leptospira terpstrae serovar Hualin str. LT 11-33 = ATCC 700639]|uniref:PF07588 family protein n=2 Tax=Leptospira TaxID=171 RepID=N1VSM9_9LEPT|nr:PF07588 family protein [Leptospira terpstrae serovar Hualin str. LT 11-33 = ATCC 700639]
MFFTPAMKTYVTAVTYSIPSIGSIAGADTICNNDSGKPVGGSFYKALLVDAAGCIGSTPCRRASITANIGDGQIDWALKPNTNYVRSDGVTPIMTTNANALFIFGTLTNSWTSAALTGISGMSGTWVTFAGLTCINYSVNSGSVTTTQYQQTGSVSLSGTSSSCTLSFTLLCIEQ